MILNPIERLLLRAFLAGLAAFLTAAQTSGGHLGRDALAGAATSAGLALLEALTPLNATVGVGKSAGP